MGSVKYHYDQENGIFVKDDDISVNWLVSQVLNIPNCQITKLSTDDINKFINLLDQTNLIMPNGEHCFVWLKRELREKAEMAGSKSGVAQYELSEKFKYIIHQIDMIMIKSNKKRFEAQETQKSININRTPNNMQISFKEK